MSDAKPQDGSTVKGYRTLTEKDIAAMNELKLLSRQFIEKLNELKQGAADELSSIGNHSVEAHEVFRWLAIARTDMQTACMAACRAVARPDSDC
ncbi:MULTISPECIES: DUF7681 family protein [Klebsiella/Raoultella group]|uniref:Acb2/Tad1 domain-containing protein n=1 Tax=Klebsiella/Raoultella group TaxID=2890311 RepID=UPI000BFF2E7B|nr:MULTISPECIES: hypothetical protein [Klebsiella/Raoultella group]ATM21075.1 hypothetical protein CRN13_12010 [Raoultella ornithinolytica]MDH1759602.1 hypothetical protein [Klebsiella michiganensis]